MTAALVAANEDLDVLLLEKTAFYGGTTAYSGGGIWVPGNSLSKATGIEDTPELAKQYVQESVGETVRLDLLDVFLDAAPKMVDYLQEKTQVQFSVQQGFPDWHPEATGFSPSGRLLCPQNFDGKVLGSYFTKLRPAMSEFNAPGGFMIGLSDMPHIPNVKKSWVSFKHIAGLLLRFGLDRLRGYSRGTRLTMGNALAARLLHSCVEAGVTLWREAPMVDLLHEAGRVTGVLVDKQGEKVQVNVRQGVVLASGGFSSNSEMRKQFIPFADQHISITAEGNMGDGISKSLELGAQFDGDNISNAGWVVVSVLENSDGSIRKFPHLFLDRGKPGCIAVNRQGRRFGNESTTNLVEPMHRSGSVPAHLICDHTFIKKYGLGLVRPGGIGLKKMLAAEYIQSAETLLALAEKIEVDVINFEATVKRFNQQATQGADDDYQRGALESDFSMGDMSHTPNPCLGPIETGPFYSVKIFPGDSTTTVGLRVNHDAQVLKKNGDLIDGLYAIGLDMNSLWRGRAPGAGANNTLGLTFAYVAANALKRKASNNNTHAEPEESERK